MESVAENTSDAVVGALVWGAVAGPAGVAAYRAANTLDAMVGHRSERYESYGWAAARLDDALSWPAARATAALTALCAPVVGGSPRATWRTVRADGAAHPSPNAGRAEAAFAGALGVRLGGPLTYGGVAELRPALGSGRPPGSEDIRRAARLSRAVGVAAACVCAASRVALTRSAAAKAAAAATGPASRGARRSAPTGLAAFATRALRSAPAGLGAAAGGARRSDPAGLGAFPTRALRRASR